MDKIEVGLVSLAVVSIVIHLLIGPYQDPLINVVEIIVYLIPPIVAVISCSYLLKHFWKKHHSSFGFWAVPRLVFVAYGRDFVGDISLFSRN